MKVHPVEEEEVLLQADQATSYGYNLSFNPQHSASYKLALVSAQASGRCSSVVDPTWSCSCGNCSQDLCTILAVHRNTCLEDLPADVLHHVLVCLNLQQIMAVKSCNSKLRAHVSAASQYWAPRVEAHLSAVPGGDDIWAALQQREQELQQEQELTHVKQQDSRLQSCPAAKAG